MASETELKEQLHRLSEALSKRSPQIATLDRYYEGEHPLPPLIQDERVSRAYRKLMRMANANWPALIVDSVQERLEVQGVRFGDQAADDEAWQIWQANSLDAGSSMLHQSTLIDGRAFAIVWGDGSQDPQPEITVEHGSLCIVEYEPGPLGRRRAALRRWCDGKNWFANLYRRDGIYKFKSSAESEQLPSTVDGWVRHDVDGEDWPLENPLEDIPVVEFAVNTSLRPNPFGTAAGEFERNLRHIDRINYKVFCGLVALTWSGFPLRALIGDPIEYEPEKDGDGKVKVDGDGDPIEKAKPPFDVSATGIVQLENPDGKLVQLPEAKIDNYSAEEDIKHLAALTKTPAHYLLGEMVNLSADAIRAAEAALVSKVHQHHRSLGESWEDVIRLALRVKNPDDPRGQDTSAEIIWRDPESRSLAERADAATKLASIGMPWSVIASKVLGMSPQEIARAESQQSALMLESLIKKPSEGGEGASA
jgi:hypothetical protein